MEKDPREIEFEIRGKKYKILLSMYGLLIAQEQGFKLERLEIGEGSEKIPLRQMLEFLWIGMLPYDESLTLRQVGMTFGINDLPVVSDVFTKMVQRQLQGVKDEDTSKKKAKSAA